jgi:hypothetical protein
MEGQMRDLTIRLAEGKDWVEIFPFGCEIGEVVGGTCFVRGDWVRRPDWLTWKEAANGDQDGTTNVGPFDLELVCDVVTGFSLLPESRRAEENRAAAGSRGAEQVQLDEEMAKLLDSVLQGREAVRPDSSPRRRRSDLAA